MAVGVVIGAIASLSIQSLGAPPTADQPATGALPRPERSLQHGSQTDAGATGIRTSAVTTSTYLAWTPGGLPNDFERRLRALRAIRRAVVVASDITWMTRSVSADGTTVDAPTRPYAIPLETTAVNPAQFSAFLPQADRSDVRAALAAGEGILGRSSAELRHLGPGGTLEFGTRSVRIAAVLPDELVGASELLVSRDLGSRLGAVQDRYALLQPRAEPSAPQLSRLLRTIVPADLPLQVRAPGETPYPRQGDAVLPPVKIKLLFGEFAARPDPANPGFLDVDPAWVRSHIQVRTLPLVGNIQCNVALFPQLRGALEELVRRGLGNLIHSEHGCYVPKFVLNDPHASISHHAWGIAFDVNLSGNEFGQPPHQDPRLVRILAKWGFLWGGRFIVPDGNHFEYRRPPAPAAP